jgi:hypothetical protein
MSIAVTTAGTPTSKITVNIDPDFHLRTGDIVSGGQTSKVFFRFADGK